MTDFISRQNANPLIPVQAAREIAEGAAKASTVMSTFSSIQMSTKPHRIPALAALPEVKWLTEDTSRKPVTKTGWENIFMDCEEAAAVVWIPKSVFEDSEYNIWQSISQRFRESIGQKVDKAVISSFEKPQSFRAGLIDSIYNANKTVPNTSDFYSDIDAAMTLVEQSGYSPSAVMGGVDIKSEFRRLLDSTGQPIRGTEIDVIPRYYVDNGAWDKTKAKLIVGDFRQALYGIRQDMELTFSEHTTIFDNAGNPHSMFQEDSVAARVRFRFAWCIPNPINILDSNPETRFPFALIEASPAHSTVNVNFTVNDSESSPVSGATIKMGGMSRKTNSTGQASFKTSKNQNYVYHVSAEGKSSVKGKTEVESVDKAVSVTMN
ncbi:hypothetical protein M9Y10_004560 [Tritrichomonas musculus]|uniref:Phage capsid-like C-terminal domain-containing protein n=1 Tax=Tritrichomonas musculus TaxID=1915356 RepID=A0ABR2GP62_9EUKA